MESPDFSRSFITFTTKGRGNNARIQVEARCQLQDATSGRAEDYYLVASCKGEDTYGKGPLFLDPNYDFCMVYSPTEFRILRTHANAERDNTTVGGNRVYFEDVRFSVRMTNALVLPDEAAIVAATLENRPLNGRSELVRPDGRLSATLEFPIKTINVHENPPMYQIDTGPILLPNFNAAESRPVERFHLAYIAYNRADEASFVVQEPTPVTPDSDNGPYVRHYSRIVRVAAKNSLLVL